MTQVQFISTAFPAEPQSPATPFPSLALVSSSDGKRLLAAAPSDSISPDVAEGICLLAPNQAVRRFADFLSAESWCIDTSNSPVKAFHALSNRLAGLEHFQAKFPKWAKENGVRVDANFAQFQDTLGKRLLSALPTVLGSAFRPEPVRFIETHVGITLANTYVPYRPERLTGLPMPAIFREFLDRIFMNREDERMVLDWCADIIQNPMRRPEWGIIMSGDHGTGKSTMATLMKKALGYNHVWQREQYAPALAKFSEVLPDNLLVCFDDAVAKSDTYESLKFIMSAKTLSVEIKYAQKLVQREVYARVLICTNQDTPFEFDGQDRRFYVCERSQLKVDLEEAKGFFEKFYEWMGEPSTDAFLYNFFMDRDLSGFKPGSTTQTQALQRMLGGPIGDFERVLEQLVKGAPRFHNERLLAALKSAGCEGVPATSIKRTMSSLGYKLARRKVPGCHKLQVDVWLPDTKRSPAFTPSEVAMIQADDSREVLRLGLVHASAA